jgi:hypothetical protein
VALATEARVSDLVVVEGHRVGEGRRIGAILEMVEGGSITTIGPFWASCLVRDFGS